MTPTPICHMSGRHRPAFRAFVASGPNVPPSRAGISHAVVAGDVCYVGGQLATDMLGRFHADTVENEAVASFLNLFAVLMASGFGVDDVVFLGLSLARLDELPAVTSVYNRFFPAAKRPARTVEQAAALPYGARFRVNGVAVREGCRRPSPCHCREQTS